MSRTSGAPCSFCSKRPIVAKALCAPCYYRQKKNGTLEYKERRKHLLQCTIEGCDKPHRARGLCEEHYYHLTKYGDIISAFGYGERRKHNLYDVWRQQARTKEGRVKAWDDFWQFVADVPQRPAGKTWQRRYDESGPYGPDNFYWQSIVGGHANRNAYMRSWNARNPLRAKHYSLRKQYGITFEQYASMYDAQQGKCAICGNHGEGVFVSFAAGEQGKSKTLVVDHDHNTGVIRKLLCHACNKAMGGFRDSTELLQKAVAYLKQHAQ